MKNRLLMSILMGAILAPCALSQVETEVPAPVSGAKPVTVQRIKVHGESLEGSLERDSADRNVFVFLPPSYEKEKTRRYPVVYALHGYSIGAEQWTKRSTFRKQSKERSHWALRR